MRWHPLREVFLAVALLASQAVQAAGDACAIQPGRWTLSYGQKYKNQSAASQFNFKISAHFYGDVAFEAECGGGAKVLGSTAAEFDVDAALALPGNAKQTAACEIPMSVTFNGLHFAAGAQANRPSASAIVSMTRAAGGKGCYGDPALLGAVEAIATAIQPTTRTMTWQISRNEADVGRPEWLSGHATWGGGDQNFFKSGNAGSATQLDSSEFGVTMVPLGKAPDLQPLIADIESVFLSRIGPVTNTYSANVADWGGKPGEVTFTLSGPGGTSIVKSIGAEQMSGNLASAQFEIGDLDPGDYTVRAVAKNAAGKSSNASDLALRINPVPEWARPFHLQVESATTGGRCGNHKCVVYSGHNVLHWPDVDAAVHDIDVPAFIPFIGGKWGFQPIAFDATIRPRSIVSDPKSADAMPSGQSLDDGPITGSGGISIAGHAISLKVRTDSAMRTPMTAAALDFTQGAVEAHGAKPSVAKFEDPDEKKVEGSIDPLSLIPGASKIYDIPVAGGFIHWMMPSIVDYSVSLGLGGAAAFGAIDGSAVKLTGGQLRLDPIVANVSLGPNSQLGGAQIIGQIAGLLGIGLNPLAIQDCNFKGQIFLQIGGALWSKTVAGPLIQVAQCQQQGTAAVNAGGDEARWFAPPGDVAPARTGLRALFNRHLASNEPLHLPSPAAATVALTIPARDGWKPEAVAIEPGKGHVPAGRSETILVRNANAFAAAPAVAVAADGHFAIAWIAEDAAKPRPVAWQTHVRLFDGKSRSDEIIAGDGTQPNEAPAVAFDNRGHVLVAWSQAKPGPGGYAQTLTRTGYDNNEIVVAVIDAATHAVRRIALTHDARPDAEPHLAAAADGTVWIAWRSAEPGGRNEFEFRAARWDGTNFGNADTFASGGYVVQWQFAARDAGMAVLAADRVDGATRTVTAFEYASGKWSGARVLANGLPAQGSSAVAFDAAGKPVFAWSAANGVALSIDGAPPASLSGNAHPLALSASAAGFSLIVADAGGLRQLDRDAVGNWHAKTLTRSFVSLTTTSLARAADGNWIVLRAEVPGLPMRGMPQNADLIANLPAKPAAR